MLFYSLKEIADLLGAEPVVIWDALHATKVKMTFAGRDAARPTFGLWSEVRDAPNPDYKRPTDPLITTELIEYAGLSPNPSHITILVDHLPATWQSRLREARMAQMRAEQGTPDYQRDAAHVDAAFKRLDDANAAMDAGNENTGAVCKARHRVEWAQEAIARLRGDDWSPPQELELLPTEPNVVPSDDEPAFDSVALGSRENLAETAGMYDGFELVALGHELDAEHWASLPTIQAKHAAMLMAGINPAQYPNPDQQAPAHADLPRYRMALGTFESHEQHDGIKRSLRDWVGLAQSHGLQIDVRVLAAVASAPAPTAPMKAELATASNDETSNTVTASAERDAQPIPHAESSEKLKKRILAAYMPATRRDQSNPFASAIA